MKDSVLKIAVLALLLVVLTAVVITARWVDESDYDHITRPSREPETTSANINCPPPQQAQTDVEATGHEVELSASWAGRIGDKLRETQQQVNSAHSPSSHSNQKPDEGGEPPDESKCIYGSDNVE